MAIINDNSRDLFKEKMLTADVFESSKTNRLRSLIEETKDIEITLDFIQYGGSLLRKLMSKVLPKI